MKTKILLLNIVLLFSLRITAQNDLLAFNFEKTNLHSSDSLGIRTDRKITVGNFMPTIGNYSAVININSAEAQTMKVRIFKMNGEMTREDSYSIISGTTELPFNFNDLVSGKFYTNDGSNMRRIMKM